MHWSCHGAEGQCTLNSSRAGLGAGRKAPEAQLLPVSGALHPGKAGSSIPRRSHGDRPRRPSSRFTQPRPGTSSDCPGRPGQPGVWTLERPPPSCTFTQRPAALPGSPQGELQGSRSGGFRLQDSQEGAGPSPSLFLLHTSSPGPLTPPALFPCSSGPSSENPWASWGSWTPSPLSGTAFLSWRSPPPCPHPCPSTREPTWQTCLSHLPRSGLWPPEPSPVLCSSHSPLAHTFHAPVFPSVL